MTAERAGGLLLAALAPLVLLAVDPWGWYPFGPAKVLALTVVGIGGAGLALGSRSPAVPRSLGLALGGLVGAMALAAVVGEEDLYAWVGTPERRFGVLAWVLCSVLLLAGRALGTAAVPALRAGLLVAGLGVGGVATAEALGWEPEVLDAGSRLTGTFGSAAYLGAAAALLLPITIGEAVDRRANRRAAGVLASVLLAVAVLGSGARAAWVGLVAALLVVLVARRRSVARAVRADRRRTLVVGAASVVAVAAVLVLSPVGARLGALSDEGAPGGAGRLDEWAVAGRVLADHPVTGVGPEGYRVAFPGEVDEGYQRAHGRDQIPDRAHSGPLDVALAGGALGLVGWLAVVVIVGRAAWRALQVGTPWQAGIAAALVAHWIGQLFFFPVIELEPIAWLLAGLLTATVPGATRARRPWVVPAAVLAMVVAAIAGVTEVVADHDAERAADALARGDGRAAATAAEAAVDQRGDVLRLHLLAAQAALLDRQGAVVALRHVDEALDLSPGDPIALRTKAQLLVDRAGSTGLPAHRDEAAAFVDQRLEADPYEPVLWRLRAALAALEGDREGARAASERAGELTPDRGSDRVS